MSKKFVKAIEDENNWKKTENDADALKSTTNSLLDLFGTIGAMRTREVTDITRGFVSAFNEDRLLATKMSFYARNIRGGLGERRTPRVIWREMAFSNPDIIEKNMHLIPVFGRWDDLYVFVDTPVEEKMWEIIVRQLNKDIEDMNNNKPISLLAKWLKSVNTSSKKSVALGKLTAKKLGMSEKTYRKTLSSMRKYIDVVEVKMSKNNWGKINYSKVPSNAMTKYRTAFFRNDIDRMNAFIEAVEKGEEKINSGTLYPYDIIEKILYNQENNKVLEEQWKALPNYVEGENNILVMADVSGSMYGRPLATSVGLAMYFGERNKGAFHNKFLTFSNKPEFVTIEEGTLLQKINSISSANWDMNTDIEKAFQLVLDTAVNNALSNEDLPTILIISDMEFDQASYEGGRATYYNKMKNKFSEKGYDLPMVIFWNVEARQNTFHAVPENGVQFASGQSTSVFKAIIDGTSMTAYDMMLNTLNDEMYDEVVV